MTRPDGRQGAPVCQDLSAQLASILSIQETEWRIQNNSIPAFVGGKNNRRSASLTGAALLTRAGYGAKRQTGRASVAKFHIAVLLRHEPTFHKPHAKGCAATSLPPNIDLKSLTRINRCGEAHVHAPKALRTVVAEDFYECTAN